MDSYQGNDHIAAAEARESARRLSKAAVRMMHRMARMAIYWHWRARSRRDLAELEEYLLDDIGIARAQALREAAKPFWRP